MAQRELWTHSLLVRSSKEKFNSKYEGIFLLIKIKRRQHSFLFAVRSRRRTRQNFSDSNISHNFRYDCKISKAVMRLSTQYSPQYHQLHHDRATKWWRLTSLIYSSGQDRLSATLCHVSSLEYIYKGYSSNPKDVMVVRTFAW